MSNETFQRFLGTLQRYSFEEYAEMNPSNLEYAKREFLANPQLPAPPFRYERRWQSYDTIKGALSGLATTHTQIKRNSQLNDFQRTTLLQIAEDYEQKLGILLAACRYRSYPTNENATIFTQRCEKRYGKMDYNLMSALLEREINQLRAKDFSGREFSLFRSLSVRTDLIQSKTPRTIYRPQPATIAVFGQLLRQNLNCIFQYLPQYKGSFTPTEVVALANQVIDRGIRPQAPTKFRAQLTQESHNLCIDQDERILRVPIDRAKGPYDRKVVESILLGHEMIHLLRGALYEQCGLPMLSTGFPGSDAAEEGIAKACETAISGDTYKPSADHYITIGLIHFFGKPCPNKPHYGFRRTFEFRRDLLYLKLVDPQGALEQKEACYQRAQNQAFNEVMRATRGTISYEWLTTPNVATVAYLKDKIYLDGSEKIWRHIEDRLSMTGSHASLISELFFSGKTDPTNSEHLRIAQWAASGAFGQNPFTASPGQHTA